jgi:hypothetical protein
MRSPAIKQSRELSCRAEKQHTIRDTASRLLPSSFKQSISFHIFSKCRPVATCFDGGIFARLLQAYSFPVSLSTTLETTPKDPFPNRSFTLYLLRVRHGTGIHVSHTCRKPRFLFFQYAMMQSSTPRNGLACYITHLSSTFLGYPNSSLIDPGPTSVAGFRVSILCAGTQPQKYPIKSLIIM